MIYKKSHFANCKLNPFDELNIDIEEKLAKYVICLFDPNSPLIKAEQNLLKRKQIAAEIAGITDTEELFTGKDKTLVPAIQNYLEHYAKSMEWALLVSLEMTFWEYTGRMQTPITDEKDTDSMRAIAAKTSLAKDAKAILDQYKSGMSEFYQQDAIVIESIGKVKRFTPENVGKA